MRGFLGHLQRRGLGKRSIARTLSAIRSFYKYLANTDDVDVNPAKMVGTPKSGQYLPSYLDRAQIELLFQMAEARAMEGGFVDVRNLAILELFYSTGMRLSELQGISKGDIDLVSQQVKVRGKGRKERIIPVGDHATLALRNYEAKREALVRQLAATADRNAVFLSRTGKRIGVRAVQKVVTGVPARDRRGFTPERSLVAAYVRDPPAGCRGGPAGGPGAAGTCVGVDDADLHAYECRAAQAGLPEVASKSLIYSGPRALGSLPA